MKKRIVRIISLLLVVILSIGCFAGSVPAFAAKKADKADNEDTGYQSGSSAEFTTVLSNDNFELLYKEATAEVAVKNLKTGYTWYTNPQNREALIGTGTQTYHNASSQIITYYYESIEMLSMDSSSQSTSVGQTLYKVDGDTLSVKYDFGVEEFSLDMLPEVISQKRLEKEILPKLSEEDRAMFEQRYILWDVNDMEKDQLEDAYIHYPILKKHNIYVRNCPAYIGEKMYKALVEIGYTTDDLQRDCDENGVTNTYEPPVRFTFVLKYTLNEDGFNVYLDTDKTVYDEKYPPIRVEILPYFGAVDGTGAGYMFVPDGSGAVINLNNSKHATDKYWQKLFDRDRALSQRIDKDESIPSVLPVFALGSKNGHSFYASIDEGYECSGIQADVAGGDSFYNYVSGFFDIVSHDVISISDRGTEDDISIRYQEDVFSGDIKISYHLVEKFAEYDEIATMYRDYLIKTGMLDGKVEKSPSMNIEFLSTARVKKNFLGFIYTKLQPLVTYEEACEIIEELGIKDVDTVYTYALNGGKKQGIISSLKPSSVLGSKSDRKDLNEVANSAYFSYQARMGNSKTSKSKASIALSRELVKVYEYDFISKYFTSSQFGVLTKISLLEKQAKKVIKSAKSKAIEAVNVTDIGYHLDSDYRIGKNTDRREARLAQESYLKELAGSSKVSVDYGSIFSMKHVSKIWNMPVASSGFAITDYDVPFYAIVARGSVAYVTPSINRSDDSTVAFLNAVEIGAGIRYTWIKNVADTTRLVDYTENYFDCLYTDSIDQAKDFGGKMADVFEKIGQSKIVSHKTVSDTFKVTTFDSGYTVYVNYADKAVNVKGKTVEAESFICFPTNEATATQQKGGSDK